MRMPRDEDVDQGNEVDFHEAIIETLTSVIESRKRSETTMSTPLSVQLQPVNRRLITGPSRLLQSAQVNSSAFESCC